MTDHHTAVTSLFEQAEARGITLEWIAAMTGKSWSTVYAYKVGRRNAQPAWVESVSLLIAAHDSPSRPRTKVV